MVVFAHHHVLDHLEVHLHAVALVADPHDLHAGMGLPFALEGLDEFPAGGELHPVAYAVEKIFVAALVHSNDHNGGAVRALARAFRRVAHDVDIHHRRNDVVIAQPCRLEGGLVAGRRIEQHLRGPSSAGRA